jgi:hypothetical protein
MKVQIYNWAGDREAGKLIEALGFKHRGYYEVEDIFALMKSLHDVGLNIMFPQPSEGVQLVAVDYKRLFTQR